MTIFMQKETLKSLRPRIPEYYLHLIGSRNKYPHAPNPEERDKTVTTKDLPEHLSQQIGLAPETITDIALTVFSSLCEMGAVEVKSHSVTITMGITPEDERVDNGSCCRLILNISPNGNGHQPPKQ